MTNLAIELLSLTVVLINFGAILTANIYSKSLEEHIRLKMEDLTGGIFRN